MVKTFYNVPDTELIWHGEWSDPEIKYKDHILNYWDVENALYDEYREICRESQKPITDDGFVDFIVNNHSIVYDNMDDMIDWMDNHE